MNAIWPDSLPCPTWGDYSVAYGDGRVAKSVDAGPPSFRRRFSRVSKTVNVTINCNVDQYAAFDIFYEETVKAGTLPFWIKDKLLDGQPVLLDDGSPLLGSDGLPILMTAMMLCRFGSTPPQVKGAPRLRQVTFPLLRMPI